MGSFPVDNGELALYFVFTFLSILASTVTYCLYHHSFRLAEPDYTEHMRFFAKVSKMNTQHTAVPHIDVPLIE